MVIIEEASSSPSTHPWKYHVFLSFRGKDTRYNFTGHLFRALDQKGIITFMDDQLTRGEEISLELLQAIELSKISIIVFSKDYASSKWCLDELIKILDCKKSKEQIVLPVFYKVDPSDIRNHRGSFEKGLASLECKFKDNVEKIQIWKAALTGAAKLSGWTLSEKCSEASVIQKLVEHISKELINSTSLDVAKYPVGIEPRVQEIHKLLGVEGRDVHMLGIWGAGGIGKTTIARAVYNSIAHEFDGSCFLENVRETSKAGGFVELQKKLLRETLRGTLEVTNVAGGITMIKERLKYKSVLLVLDDVSDIRQLDSLTGECRWFGKGSKIIITTRDKKLLARHSVDLIYKVQELAHDEALELFSQNAFKSNRPSVGYEELTEKVISYARGLPLALTVLGSSLWGGDVEKWQAALDGSESREIKDVLQISYELLDDALKAAFLDIACFFKGEYKEDVVQTLEAIGRRHSKVVIDELIEKALISIDKDGIRMHDLVEEMGRDIVYRQSPDDPGRRSRLWFHEDVYRVLTENIGTANIIGIKVKLPEDSDVVCFSDTTFSNLPNLRLFIYRAGHYSGVVDNVPKSLRVVDWPNCHLQFSTSALPRDLVLLNMPESRITVLGNELKHLRYLTSLNLSGSPYLTKVSDLSGIPNLQNLELSSCHNLVEVHPYIGFLDKLAFLNLRGCWKLVTFPTEVRWNSMKELLLPFCVRLDSFISIVHNLDAIEILDLCGSGIKELHSWIGCCTSLEVLVLSETAIKQLPSSIGNLTSLLQLKASETLIEELPSSIGKLTSLRALKLSKTPLNGLPSSIGCLIFLEVLDVSETFIEQLPASVTNIASLRELNLYKTRIKELPSSVGCLISLEILDASNTSIEELPPSIGDLTSLRKLKVSSTPIRELPSSIGNLTSLSKLNVSNTLIKELPSSIGCLTSLEKLDASETLIEELPLSIGELICLGHLKLNGCANLTNVPHSVYGGLQNLKLLDLSRCVKLVTFPCRPSALVSSSAESLTPMLPTYSTYSNNGHDDCVALLFPCLRCVRFCPLSVSDFLPNLDCFTTLWTLDLSGSSFDSLPACISNFRRLEYLDLGGCKNLRDISELPAYIQGINLDDCVSLERFSKLSNMLEQKDSLGYLISMNLSNCHRLVDNLGMNIVSKMAKALLDKLLADGSAGYDGWDHCNIILPNLRGIEVPDWCYSGNVDVLRGHGTKYSTCELVIKMPRTLKGKNIRLVVCAVYEITQNFSGGCTPFVKSKRPFHGSQLEELSADDNVCVCFARTDIKVVDHEVRVNENQIMLYKSDAHVFSLESFGVQLANLQQTDDDHVSGEDLALEVYWSIKGGSSDFESEEGASIASVVSDDCNSVEVNDDHHDGEQEQEEEPHLPGTRLEDMARQTNMSRAMLAFLKCFGITCL